MNAEKTPMQRPEWRWFFPPISVLRQKESAFWRSKNADEPLLPLFHFGRLTTPILAVLSIIGGGWYLHSVMAPYLGSGVAYALSAIIVHVVEMAKYILTPVMVSQWLLRRYGTAACMLIILACIYAASAWMSLGGILAYTRQDHELSNQVEQEGASQELQEVARYYDSLIASEAMRYDRVGEAATESGSFRYGSVQKQLLGMQERIEQLQDEKRESIEARKQMQEQKSVLLIEKQEVGKQEALAIGIALEVFLFLLLSFSTYFRYLAGKTGKAGANPEESTLPIVSSALPPQSVAKETPEEKTTATEQSPQDIDSKIREMLMEEIPYREIQSQLSVGSARVSRVSKELQAEKDGEALNRKAD